MERNLLLISAGIGVAVWLCGALSGLFIRRSGTATLKLPMLFRIAMFAVPLIVFCITLPTTPPLFAPGSGFGIGFLVGGFACIIACWNLFSTLRASADGQPFVRSAGIVAPLGIALAASIVPAIWLRHFLLDGVLGVAIGWFCITMLAIVGLMTAEPSESHPPARLGLVFHAGSTVLFCMMMGMGVLGGKLSLPGTVPTLAYWSVVGAMFTAGVLVILLVANLPAVFAYRIPGVLALIGLVERGATNDEAKQRIGRRWRAILVAIAILSFAKVLAVRFTSLTDSQMTASNPILNFFLTALGASPIFPVVLVGLVSALLCRWVCMERARVENEGNSGAIGWQNSAVAALLVVACYLLAFSRHGGFGFSLAFIAFMALASLSLGTAISNRNERTVSAVLLLPTAGFLTRFFLFGVIIALYRLFTVRFASDVRGASLTDYFGLIGMLTGVLLPVMINGQLGRDPSALVNKSGLGMFRLFLQALLTLLVPALMVTLMGAKCGQALLIGLALSVVIFEVSFLPALLAVGIALALGQWTHHIMPWSELTRSQKVNLLLMQGAAIVVIYLISAFMSRGRNGTNPQNLSGRQTAKGGVQ